MASCLPAPAAILSRPRLLPSAPGMLPRRPLPVSPPHLLRSPLAKSQPLIPISPSTKAPTPTLHPNKVAIFLAGALLFAARLAARPPLALALAAPARPPALEESVDGRSVNPEEEGMFERILERNPKDMEALKMVLYARMKKGRMEEAAKLVERMIELQPDEVDWMLLQALCLELSGRLAEAKRVFLEILDERPLMPKALHGLAMVMHKNNEGLDVFEMLNKALELARREEKVTEERNIKILIAQMHLVKGDLEGASKHYKNLIKENPRDFRPYLCQGIVYSLLGKNKEADEQFEIYKSLVPDEFPQKTFMDDIVLAVKTEPQEKLGKGFRSSIL